MAQRDQSRSPWRVACFDLDGTLVRGTSVSRHLAACFGQSERAAELERLYAAGDISNATVASEQAQSFTGASLESIISMLSDIPCIGGIDATLTALQARKVDSLLCTVTWSFAAQEFRRRHGFAAVSGTELDLDSDNVPTGEVKRQFDEWDKLEFVTSYCKSNDVDLAECIAIGDSRSDIPLFQAVGFSVALNATAQAREAATVALDSEMLTDILRIIPWHP